MVTMTKTNEERIAILESKVENLEKHDSDCDARHEQTREHNRRADDSMNRLTHSNETLAESITCMNATLNKVVGIIERDEPDIMLVKNARIAWKVNKWIFITVVAFVAGLTTFWTFYKGFL